MAKSKFSQCLFYCLQLVESSAPPTDLYKKRNSPKDG